MNEGLADFFSSAIAGDPDVGEYASKDFAPNLTAIRSLSSPDKCPSEIGGEVHQDATLFSGGLWDVRSGLSAEQALVYDEAVFTAMNNSPTGDLGYEDFAQLVVSAIEASTLGATVADAQTAAFTARGVLPKCNRVLEAPLGDVMKGPKDLQTIWFALGTQTTGLNNPVGFSPGIVQFHTTLPSNATTLSVELRTVDVGGGGGPFGGTATPFKPKLVVRFGADPIGFTYGPYAVSADAVQADFTTGTTVTSSVAVPTGATSAYVMIASTGQADGAYTNVTLTSDGSAGTGGTAGTGGSAGTGGTAGTAGTGGTAGTAGTGGTSGTAGSSSGAKATPASADDSGCGCRVPTSSTTSSSTGLGVLALLGLAAMRRRKLSGNALERAHSSLSEKLSLGGLVRREAYISCATGSPSRGMDSSISASSAALRGRSAMRFRRQVITATSSPTGMPRSGRRCRMFWGI
jgi:MYXO-CTERM domain-containing protein